MNKKRNIYIVWDFQNSEHSNLNYSDALDISGLPTNVAIPKHLKSEEDIDYWIEETYGYKYESWMDADYSEF